jgi:hypothetical protein
MTDAPGQDHKAPLAGPKSMQEPDNPDHPLARPKSTRQPREREPEAKNAENAQEAGEAGEELPFGGPVPPFRPYPTEGPHAQIWTWAGCGKLAIKASILASMTASQIAFYATTATVIPVLLLALAVQDRLYQDAAARSSFMMMVILVNLTAGIAGEVLALLILALGHEASSIIRITVYACALVLLIALGARPTVAILFK